MLIIKHISAPEYFKQIPLKKKKISRGQLINIAKRTEKDLSLTPSEAENLLNFDSTPKEQKVWDIVQKIGLPLSIIFGLTIVLFPEFIESIIAALPSWLYLSPRIAAAFDYIWGIIGNPIEKEHIIYHLPNILLYSFGVLEIRSLVLAIQNKGWKNRVINAQKKIKDKLLKGKIFWDLKTGFSVLFTGGGDFIGEEIAKRSKTMALTLSERMPSYTTIWNRYKFESPYDSLRTILKLSDAGDAGEYIFFPVEDTEIFLPAESSYDIAPHKLDLLIQNIRSIEDEFEWTNKRIVIVGDKYHESIIQTENKLEPIKDSIERITLALIAKRHTGVTLIDPTDVVIEKILHIANGRKILFRASTQGMHEYKDRFYKRLEEMGYKEDNSEETLIIGYDLLEDQTEQQSISNKTHNYLPVVLSSIVLESLLTNGYKKHQLLYVPELIIQKVQEIASEQ